MAKRKAAPEPLKEFTPPRAGGKEVKSAFGQFWTPEKQGDNIEGVLVGTTPIYSKSADKNVDRYVLLDGAGKTWTLPDHFDLVEKVKALPDFTRVYIEYLGRVEIKTRKYGTVQSPRYGIVDYGVQPGARDLLAAAKGADEQVPF